MISLKSVSSCFAFTPGKTRKRIGVASVLILMLQYLPALGQQMPQQQVPPQQPQQGQTSPAPQQGQQGPGQQASPAQQGQTPSVPKSNDAISRAKAALDKTAAQAAAQKALLIDPIPAKIAQVGDQITFKVVARDPSLTPGITFTYSLSGAPQGAYIDPQTGTFSWIPSVAGNYTFYVMVSDNLDTPRTASTQIQINVKQQLLPFGYSFFTDARNLVNYRRYALMNQYIPLGVREPPQFGLQSSGQVISNMQQLQQVPGLIGALQGQQNLFNGYGTGSSAIVPQNQLQLPQGSFNGSTNPVNPFQGTIGGAGGSAQGATGAQGQQLTPLQQYMINQLNLNPTAIQGLAQGQGQFGQGQPGAGQGLGQNPGQGFGSQGQSVFPNATGNAPTPGGQGMFNQTTPALGVATVGSQPAFNPASPIPAPGIPQVNLQTGGNSYSADAMRSFVGPWDMVGYNVWIPAPERYQLGPGDLLTAHFWSPTVSGQDVDLKVDERGDISVPMTGEKVSVRGQSLNQAQDYLKRKLQNIVKNADLTLTLKSLRTMTLTVIGDAYAPGSYQVPSVATLFNALYMFGGPADTGSLRDIELRRTDGSVRVFDMYKFLVYQDTKQDVPLQPGDTIWIAPVKARVTVTGEVLRPAIYEVGPNDHLRQLIDFAGGPKPTGVTQRVSLQTVSPGVGRTLRDVDLTAAGPESNPPVFDGDIAEVFSVRSEYTNEIVVDGAVDQPGNYAYMQGVTVADIIARARGLLKEAYPIRADLFRLNPDKSTTLLRVDLQRALVRDPAANFALRPNDRLVVYDVRDVEWRGDRRITLRGAVQKPGDYYRSDNMRVLDLLLQAGGLAPDAAPKGGYLQRTNPDGTLGPVINIDFLRAAVDPNANVELMDKDVLTVQTVQEAQYIPSQTVQILGAVQTPSTYPRGTNMKLSTLIHLAGGPNPNASNEVEIQHARVPDSTPRTKVSLSAVLAGNPEADVMVQDGDLVTIPERSDIQLTTQRVILMGAVQKPGPYAINGKTDRLSGLIARAGGPAPDAYIRGVEFYRDPKHLATDAQMSVSPRVQTAFNEVAQQQYQLAIARSDVEKARFISSAGGGAPAISLPGAGGTVSQSSVTIPYQVVAQQAVTPERSLTTDDLTPAGNLNIDLPDALRHKGGIHDVVLKDGDIIVVPTTPTTVTVVGAVIVPGSVVYEPGRSVGYYVNHGAGGYAFDAAKDHILVLRYGGQVVKATGSTRVQLGDIIWVPTQVMAAKFSDKTAEVEAVSKTVTSGAILLAILRALIK